MGGIAFGKRLAQTLERDIDCHIPSSEIYAATEVVTLAGDVTAANGREDLDKLGTRLWNLASKCKDGVTGRWEFLCAGA